MHIHLPLWALTSRLLSLEKAAHASRAHLVGWMLRLFISKQPTPWANLSRNTLSEQPRVSDQATALAEKPQRRLCDFWSMMTNSWTSASPEVFVLRRRTMAAFSSRASGTSSKVKETSSAVRVRQSKPSTKAVAGRGSCQSGHYLQCDWKYCGGNSCLLHAPASGQLSPRLCFTGGTKNN